MFVAFESKDYVRQNTQLAVLLGGEWNRYDILRIERLSGGWRAVLR